MKATTRMLAILLAPCMMAGGDLVAQSYSQSPFREEPSQPISRFRKSPVPPPVALLVVDEVPLPGPLPPGELRLEDGTIRIPVAGGIARVALDGDGDPQVVLKDSAEEGLLGIAWVHGGPGEKFRYRTFPEGRLVAQRRGFGWSREWRTSWKLRTPGGTPSPPLADRSHVIYGCTDNRIYAVRARNGHRLWAHDVEERVTRPLALWEGDLSEQSFRMVLAIPDGGSTVIALDPFDGKRLATHRLANPVESLVSHPLVIDGGRIVAAVQKYKPSEAGLLIFEVVPADRLVGGNAEREDEVKDESDR